MVSTPTVTTVVAVSRLQDDVHHSLASVGAEITESEPSALAAFLGKEIARWREIIRTAKITID